VENIPDLHRRPIHYEIRDDGVEADIGRNILFENGIGRNDAGKPGALQAIDPVQIRGECHIAILLYHMSPEL